NNQFEKDYQKAKDLMKKNKYIQAVLHLESVLKKGNSDKDKDLLKEIYRDIIFAYRTINNKTRADYHLAKAVGIFGQIDEIEIVSDKKTKEEIKKEETKEEIKEESKVEVAEEILLEEPIIENDGLNSEEINNSDEIIVEETIANESTPEDTVVVDIPQNEITQKNSIQTEEREAVVLKTVKDFEILKNTYKVKAIDTNEINFNNIFVEIFTAVESKKYFGYFKLNLNKLKDVVEKGVEGLESEEASRIKWEIKTLLNLIEDNNITNFDMMYKMEFEVSYAGDDGSEDKPLQFEEPGVIDFGSNETFTFNEQDKSEIKLETTEEEKLEIEKGIDNIVSKNIDSADPGSIFGFEENNVTIDHPIDSIVDNLSEDHFVNEDQLDINDNVNNNKELEVKNEDLESKEEIIASEDTKEDSDSASEGVKQQEAIIVEIDTEKVRENNLEVSEVRDVVLEVLENLRKSDLDIFTELKEEADKRAQKLGEEREIKGLVSGLEGMLEIKFGVVSLDIVPQMKKIKNLDVLYEIKEKMLSTRDFSEVTKIIDSNN
ncbi:MAG: hypothetical protein JXM74_00170, partial [Fusobacteriaceae bacterium]|nr:hypothetical protein [Fusobacteriaceae bacterium]